MGKCCFTKQVSDRKSKLQFYGRHHAGDLREMRRNAIGNNSGGKCRWRNLGQISKRFSFVDRMFGWMHRRTRVYRPLQEFLQMPCESFWKHDRWRSRGIFSDHSCNKGSVQSHSSNAALRGTDRVGSSHRKPPESSDAERLEHPFCCSYKLE